MEILNEKGSHMRKTFHMSVLLYTSVYPDPKEAVDTEKGQEAL